MSYTIEELEKMDFSDISTGEKLESHYHPGKFLKEELLDPLGITIYKLAKDIKVPSRRLYSIIHEERGISVDTAIRLARYFNMSVGFWLNLQLKYEARKQEKEHQSEYESIQPFHKV